MEKLVWVIWAVRFGKYVLAPAFLVFIGWGTMTILEHERAPRSYVTYLNQPVTTEPLQIGYDDCRRLAEVLALSASARAEFKVSCVK